jgi:hypothetical protein
MTQAGTLRQPRRQGVVLIITLLGMALLVSLILFVLNLGGQVNRRQSAQDAADATAMAAATWTARSMNVVAMNNTAMARTIALINILDAMPQAAWNVEDETKAFLESLKAQLARGIPGGPARLDNAVELMLEQLRLELVETLDQVEPVAELFNRYDVRELTHYNRNGALWRQLYALDEMNQTVMENLALLVQRHAMAAGREAVAEADRQDGGMVVLPLEPNLPHRRGQFNDFRDPTVKGILPPDIDHNRTNRGPWDTVYGWRTTEARTTGGEQIDGDIGGASGNAGRGPGASGNGGNDSRNIGGERNVVAYQPYGPRGWYLRRVDDFTENRLPHTRLDMWVREISELKLNQLWPDVTEHYDHFHNTEWISDYEQARALAETYHRTRRLPRVLQTAYFMVEIKSKYPIGHARFMNDGTWLAIHSPRIEYFGPQNGANHGTANRSTGGYAGWYDADRWGFDRLGNYIWRNHWQYVVEWDHTIGIQPRATGAGFEPQPVHRYDFYVFAGANIDWDKQTESPWTDFNPNADDAPAPMNLNHSALDFDNDDARWRFLSYLALVHHSDQPQAWSRRFRGGRPTEDLVALAQAKVFNNHSFDMWTPMWHAKLEPVSQRNGEPGLDDWLAVLQAEDNVPYHVNPDDVDTFLAYIESIARLAPTTLTH